jgi:hypothetical protein
MLWLASCSFWLLLLLQLLLLLLMMMMLLLQLQRLLLLLQKVMVFPELVASLGDWQHLETCDCSCCWMWWCLLISLMWAAQGGVQGAEGEVPRTAAVCLVAEELESGG